MKIKGFISCALACTILAVSAPMQTVMAQTAQTAFCTQEKTVKREKIGPFTFSVTPSAATLIECDKDAEGDLVVPNFVDGDTPVKKISDNAFERCNKITSIGLPLYAETIGVLAFAYCSNLKWVVVEEGTTRIGNGAFLQCPSLEEVTIINTSCYIDGGDLTISNGMNGENAYYNGKICAFSGSRAQTYAANCGYKFESIGVDYLLGDVDRDGMITAYDASKTLTEYTYISSGNEPSFNESEQAAADIDVDGMITAYDASLILTFYTYLSGNAKITEMAEWYDDLISKS